MHFRLFVVTLGRFGDVSYKIYIDFFSDFSHHGYYRGLRPQHRGVVIPLDTISTTIYFNSNPNTADIPRIPRYYRQYRSHSGLY